jgi:hypothetical protein
MESPRHGVGVDAGEAHLPRPTCCNGGAAFHGRKWLG